MKFVIRRLLVGVLALPVVAGVYLFGYVALIALGAEPTASLGEAWGNGLLVGSVSAVAFGFATQLDKFVSKVVGEGN